MAPSCREVKSLALTCHPGRNISDSLTSETAVCGSIGFPLSVVTAVTEQRGSLPGTSGHYRMPADLKGLPGHHAGSHDQEPEATFAGIRSRCRTPVVYQTQGQKPN